MGVESCTRAKGAPTAPPLPDGLCVDEASAVVDGARTRVGAFGVSAGAAATARATRTAESPFRHESTGFALESPGAR